MQALFDKTLSTLIRVRNVFTGHWGMTSIVLEYQHILVAEWDGALVLPANIRYGMQQIFDTSAALRNNNWLRRLDDNPLAGSCYPLETFALNIEPTSHHSTSGPRPEKNTKDSELDSQHLRTIGSPHLMIRMMMLTWVRRWQGCSKARGSTLCAKSYIVQPCIGTHLQAGNLNCLRLI